MLLYWSHFRNPGSQRGGKFLPKGIMPTSEQHALGARLGSARLKAGISPLEASKITGISERRYRMYERGAAPIPAATLQRLASAFGIPADGFFPRALNQPQSLSTASQGEHRELATEESSPTVSSRRCLLYADDDPNVLAVGRIMLRHEGFDVAVASSGEEGLAIFRSGRKFDGVITDFVMPGLDGLSLLEFIFALDASMPAMVVTGYAQESRLCQLPPRVHVLHKPFTRLEFVEGVKRMLRLPSAALRPSQSPE